MDKFVLMGKRWEIPGDTVMSSSCFERLGDRKRCSCREGGGDIKKNDIAE